MTKRGHLAKIATRQCSSQSVFTRPRPTVDGVSVTGAACSAPCLTPDCALIGPAKRIAPSNGARIVAPTSVSRGAKELFFLPIISFPLPRRTLAHQRANADTGSDNPFPRDPHRGEKRPATFYAGAKKMPTTRFFNA